MTNTVANVALLAPVPLVHLMAGADIAKREGRVAFGSRAWDVFRELDALRRRPPCRTADEIRVGDQHEIRQGALAHYPTVASTQGRSHH